VLYPPKSICTRKTAFKCLRQQTVPPTLTGRPNGWFSHVGLTQSAPRFRGAVKVDPTCENDRSSRSVRVGGHLAVGLDHSLHQVRSGQCVVCSVQCAVCRVKCVGCSVEGEEGRASGLVTCGSWRWAWTILCIRPNFWSISFRMPNSYFVVLRWSHPCYLKPYFYS
jgi:hypothetical protein